MTPVRASRVPLLLVALLAGMLLVPATATAAIRGLSAVRVIGGPGPAGLYGWGVEEIPTGPRAGHVLVTDYWNLRVVEYDVGGHVVGTPVTDDGRHEAPYDVAVNPVNGNIAIGDVDGGRNVEIYSGDGAWLRSCGSASLWNYPAWLDYDATGRLAVADSRGQRIHVINDATCAVRFSFGSSGSGATQFRTPRGLDFAPDGTLWINDVNNGRVSHWQLGAGSATPLGSFPVSGADNRGLVYHDASDQLYVVNASAATIDVYTTSGVLVRTFGGRGATEGRFMDGGRGIAEDLDGNLWVGDMPNFRAQKFSPTGQFLLSAPSPAQPPPLGGYRLPGGVAVLGDGRIAGLDSFNWRVNLHAADGTPLSQFGSRLVFNYPRGLAADRAGGTLVVANTDGNQVDKYTPSGTRLWSADGVKAFSVAVDQSNGLIYAARFIDNAVTVLDPNGAVVRQFGSSAQLSNPRGIAVDPVDGSVWVSNQGTGRIVHYSPTGTLLGSFASGAGQAADLEVDQDTVYLADRTGNRIRWYSKAGAAQGSFGSAGSGLGRFSSPMGMDLVGGRLFVIEFGGQRIQELRINR